MTRCLSSLAPLDREGIAPGAMRRLTGGRRTLPCRLDFTRADLGQVQAESAEHMSISGVQDKISLRLKRGRLLPTERDGEFLLKPVPSTPIPRFAADIPANEHLGMQLASQVFDLATAPNTLVRLADGELAYLCRRFDRDSSGAKLRQEDFCSLGGRSEDTDGPGFKYQGSYEGLARLVDRHCSSAAVQKERLLRQVVFNFLLGNGDAHLKNFSLLETALGDFVLSPAYDLLSTSICFPEETPLALTLFDDDVRTPFAANGYYSGPDFRLFAERVGLRRVRAERILSQVAANAASVQRLIAASYLSPDAQGALVELTAARRELIAREH